MHNSKPTTWNGIEYPSIQAAADDNGITRQAMQSRLDYGYTSDADMRQAKKSWQRKNERLKRRHGTMHHREPRDVIKHVDMRR